MIGPDKETMKPLTLIGAACAFLIAAPAAATEDDFNIWGGQFIFVDLDEEGEVFVQKRRNASPTMPIVSGNCCCARSSASISTTLSMSAAVMPTY